MPLRIYPIRPLYRGRGYYGAQQQGSPAAAFTGGEAMGKMAGGAIGEFQKWQAQQALDKQANQLMTPPNQPVDQQGTLGDEPLVNEIVNPRFTGGVAGMKLQQEFIKNQFENQKMAAALRQQQVAQSLAARRGGGGGGGGNVSRWQQYLGSGKSGQVDQYGNPIKAGKPAAYQPNSSTVDDPTNYYNFNHQRIDIDNQYGKGTYDKLLANAGNITVDPKTGKYGVKTTTDPDTGKPVPVNPDLSVDPDTGEVTLKASGQHAGAHIPFNDLQQNMTRYDATLVQQGKQPRFSDQYLKSQHPESGLPGGDAANPYTPQNNGQLDAIAPGKSYIDNTDGKTYTKQQPAKQAAPPTKATTQVDTGDQGQQVADAQQPPNQQQLTLASGQPQTQMPSLLQPLNAGHPQIPQQGLTGTDQGQGQDYTGGQALPQLSPVVPQAPVDVAAATASNTPGNFFPGGASSDGGLPQDQQLADEIKRSQMASYLQGVA